MKESVTFLCKHNAKYIIYILYDANYTCLLFFFVIGPIQYLLEHMKCKTAAMNQNLPFIQGRTLATLSSAPISLLSPANSFLHDIIQKRILKRRSGK